MENSHKMESNASSFENLDEKYRYTSVGCLVDYLKANGHTPIEVLIDYVSSIRHLMTTSEGKPFTKNAFEIVDFALKWYPKIFKLDGQFNYYLNEEEAIKHKNHFKTEKSRRTNHYRKRAEIIKEKRRMKRIKNQIESDLNGSPQNYSVMTKAYLMLSSENKERADNLKKIIGEAYTAFINKALS
ncbi:unnamed protein product [Blepharisma stoltei]|uniref:Uncharacterized protein n=1 Tax=Blepharisma stoltei TaxID=1481888 RepID=A0AAU9IJ27_9CILI|nr:unnamed protein product [Blepharisma stoltei]